MIAVDRLGLAYAEGPPVLRDISLDVEPGEFVVLAGASGSGKSSLLGVLCGLVPHATGGTAQGSVHVAGVDLRTAQPGDFAGIVGYVGQEPERQVVLTTVRAELALGPELAGEPQGAVERAVEEVALALGLAGLLDRQLTTLSGGELQRVALGAALTRGPGLLVLDEPTSQLDPVAGDELLGLLRRLNQEWGLTILLAEHRLERCLPAADRVVALEAGQVAFAGEPAAFTAWAAEQAPALATSGARLLARLDRSLASEAVSVKRARAALAGRGLLPVATPTSSLPPAPPSPERAATRRPRFLSRRQASTTQEPAVRTTNLWREASPTQPILRGVDLAIAPGEAVALMGRNGAGKSTLLRALAALDAPDRGRVERVGRVALLVQRSADHLLRDRVGDELPGIDLSTIGLNPALADRHPRDLSGGEQQLLAAALVSGDESPALLCLDEPTRGLDRLHRERLAAELARRRAQGTATLVATHDPEFAAAVADRVILLGQGTVLADGPATEILEGGWYFVTEIARILQEPGVITAEQAAAVLAARVPNDSALAGTVAERESRT